MIHMSYYSDKNGGFVSNDTFPKGITYKDTKPKLSIDYEWFTYTKDVYSEICYYKDNEIVKTTISEDIQKELDNIIINWEKPIKEQIAEYKQYLLDTDWYIIRFNDPTDGKEIPEEINIKRTEARKKINDLEIKLNIGEK